MRVEARAVEAEVFEPIAVCAVLPLAVAPEPLLHAGQDVELEVDPDEVIDAPHLLERVGDDVFVEDVEERRRSSRARAPSERSIARIAFAPN